MKASKREFMRAGMKAYEAVDEYIRVLNSPRLLGVCEVCGERHRFPDMRYKCVVCGKLTCGVELRLTSDFDPACPHCGGSLAVEKEVG